MKNLEQIEREVGEELFKRWESEAEQLLFQSPYPYNCTHAKSAFKYATIYGWYSSQGKSDTPKGKRGALQL